MIRYLVFEGGGIKAVAYAGALMELYDRGYLGRDNLTVKYMETIDGVAGSSIGALVATLLAAGYSPHDMYDMLMELDFGNFIEPRFCGFMCCWWCCAKAKKGLHSTVKMQDYIADLIEQAGYDKDITFAEFHQATGIDVVITGTNISTNDPEYRTTFFRYATHPNMSVTKALTISMAYPILFDAVEHEGEWYADGGITYNMPYTAFDDEQDGYLKPGILGLKLYAAEQLNGAPWDIEGKNKRAYLVRLFDLITENTGDLQQYMDDKHKEKTICIDTGDVETFDELAEEDKLGLIEAGRRAVVEFGGLHYL